MKFDLKRLTSYCYYKIVRAGGSPDYIARGWAIGMFIGCVIPMSFQIMISVPLSFLLKGSKIGAVLGTLITNPVSIIFIYPLQCFIGSKLIGGSLTLAAAQEAMKGVLQEQSWGALARLGTDLLVSFFAGGLLFALILTPITYLTVCQAVVRYRKIRDMLKAEKQKAAK